MHILIRSCLSKNRGVTFIARPATTHISTATENVHLLLVLTYTAATYKSTFEA